MPLSSRVRVAVLRGGPSSEYEASLKTGGHVLEILRQMPEKYEPLDIFISKDGEWHYEGLVEEPHRALKHADAVWNTLHGFPDLGKEAYRIPESLGIPLVGTSITTSVLATNPDSARNIYRRHALITPNHTILNESGFDDRILVEVFRTHLFPVIIKPAGIVSSTFSWLAHTFQELKNAVREAFKHSKKVLVEERIPGQEVFCSVIENAKGEKVYALIPVAKSGEKIRTEDGKKVEEMAKLAHGALHLRHYSASEFVVTPKGNAHIISTNPRPALHKESLMHKSLGDTGWRPHDFVDHVIRLSL